MSFKEHVTIDDIYEAYRSCRKHKRMKKSAIAYEIDYEINNYKLWEDLNNMEYEPLPSNAFLLKSQL